MMNATNKALAEYECPVCGFDRLKERPEGGEVCPSCGTQFESEGFDRDYSQLRSDWIADGMPWFSRGVVPPRNWSPYRQLIIAGHGSDLLAHPRMKTEAEYRYAVDEAFSDVRIAKQLRLIREVRPQPLTQLALADKADMKQSRISELEGMHYSSWSVSTLRRLAKALGVRFSFVFESWRELGPEIEDGLTTKALWKPSFENDPAFHPEIAGNTETMILGVGGTGKTAAFVVHEYAKNLSVSFKGVKDVQSYDALESPKESPNRKPVIFSVGSPRPFVTLGNKRSA